MKSFWQFALLIMTFPSTPFAATLWDANEIYRSSAVMGPERQIEVSKSDGAAGRIKVDHLAALIEAHNKIGEVSKINVKLAIYIDEDINALAIYPKNLIAFSTGLINTFGNNKNVLAAVMAHEFAHFSQKHALEALVNVPNVRRSARANADVALKETGSQKLAFVVGRLTNDMLEMSFNRQQEYEADSVGTEYLARAGYDPKGISEFFSAMLRLTGKKSANYLDSHPGFEERIASAEPLIAIQQFVMSAEVLSKSRDYKKLALLVDQWLQRFPENGEAWYYRGLVLKARRNSGALYAFAKAVQNSPTYPGARFELCVALYNAGQERESLVCAEHLALNQERDEFVDRTFKHPIYVGGNAPRRVISDDDALIIALVLGRPDLIPKNILLRLSGEERRREVALNRQAAADERRVQYLRVICDRAKAMPAGTLQAAYIKRDCGAYDDAIRQQHLNALGRH